MTQPIERDRIYRGRRFQTETIELCVRWYITYRLSYRDLAAMMAERGVIVSHTSIMRWVLRYVPEYEKRWARSARRVGTSWRVDETAIRVRGKSAYLYRAVDKHGNSVDWSCERIAAWRPRKHSSATRSPRNMRGGRGKLISMAMPRATAHCAFLDRRIPDGGPSRFAIVVISTTSLSRTIVQSNDAAHRCWASSP